MEVIHHYYRDDVEIPYEEWMAAFISDLDVEREEDKEMWGYFPINGDVTINGHLYQTREEKIFSSAKDTLREIYRYGDIAEIYEAIEHMSEQDARDFLYYFRRARIEYEQFVLMDEMDFEWGS